MYLVTLYQKTELLTISTHLKLNSTLRQIITTYIQEATLKKYYLGKQSSSMKIAYCFRFIKKGKPSNICYF